MTTRRAASAAEGRPRGWYPDPLARYELRWRDDDGYWTSNVKGPNGLCVKDAQMKERERWIGSPTK